MNETRNEEAITPTNGEKWFEKFFGTISDQLQDLSYVDILTVSSGDINVDIDTKAPVLKDELKSKGFRLLAETKIELDGDVVTVLPISDAKGKVNKEIMDIHSGNVTTAVQNWNNVLNMIVNTIQVFAGFAGIKNEDIFNKFRIDTRV